MPIRAVVDTNVLVSSLIRRSGPPARLVEAFLVDEYSLVTSPELIAELADVIGRDRIVRAIKGRTDLAEELVAGIRAGALFVHPTFRLDVVPRDSADNRVVEAAVAGNADYIVSGDADLVSLGSVAGIRVVTPAEMLAILEAPSPGA